VINLSCQDPQHPHLLRTAEKFKFSSVPTDYNNTQTTDRQESQEAGKTIVRCDLPIATDKNLKKKKLYSVSNMQIFVRLGFSSLGGLSCFFRHWGLVWGTVWVGFSGLAFYLKTDSLIRDISGAPLHDQWHT
jgi:hypothetical protein